jgi:hypothetical protein
VNLHRGSNVRICGCRYFYGQLKGLRVIVDCKQMQQQLGLFEAQAGIDVRCNAVHWWQCCALVEG